MGEDLEAPRRSLNGGSRARSLVGRILLVTSIAFAVGPCGASASTSGAAFSDVPAGAYFAPAVEWASSGGITTGSSDPSLFKPGAPVTRAQAVTFLWRAVGLPEAQPSSLSDVVDGSYYEAAVDWALEQGIANGVTGGGFAPNRQITRAEAVTFLWRAQGSPSAPAHPFVDMAGHGWAEGAVAWARSAGVTTGVSYYRFEPARGVSRAEDLTMLWRTLISPATPPPSPTGPDGWRLLWSDEFDSGLSSAWKPYNNTYGDGNNELACLTPDNVSVRDGSLRIDARRERVTCPDGSEREFSSGFLGTRETGTFFPRYARFEIRAKLPHGQGLWPAFWLRHRNGSSVGEVDVMEYFHSQVPGRTTGTLHLDGRSNVSKRSVAFETPSDSPGWHTWAVEIEPVPGGVLFTFELDGEPYHSYTDTQNDWASSAPPDATWDLAVNMAVGGNWVGDPDDALGYLRNLDRCSQGGTPPACDATGIRRASFPGTYEVDYVRVYTR